MVPPPYSRTVPASPRFVPVLAGTLVPDEVHPSRVDGCQSQVGIIMPVLTQLHVL